MTANRSLEYAFQTNAMDYLFVVNPNADTNVGNKKTDEWEEENSWIGQGSYEIYYGPSNALSKFEGEGRRKYIQTMLGNEPAQIQFPSDGGYGEEANPTFCLATTGGMRGGYKFKKTLTRLDPLNLPRDLFELLDVPQPSAPKFQLKK